MSLPKKKKKKKPTTLVERFEALVPKYSADTKTKKKKGLVDKFKWDKRRPLLSKSISEAPLKKLAPLVEENDGFYIVLVDTRIPNDFEASKRKTAAEFVKGEKLDTALKAAAKAFFALAQKTPKQSLKVAAKTFNAQVRKTLNIPAPEKGDDTKKKGKEKETDKTKKKSKKTPPRPALVQVIELEPFARVDTERFPESRAAESWDSIKKVGRSKKLAKKLFTLTTDKPLLDEVFTLKKAHFVIRLTKIVPADPKKDAKKLERLRLRLISQKSSAMYRELVRQMFDKMKADKSIIDDEGKIKIYNNAVKAIQKQQLAVFKGLAQLLTPKTLK